MHKAVITGVTGQDGYYLTRLLLNKGYRVIGVRRRTSLPTDRRLAAFRGTPNFVLVDGDVTDQGSIEQIVGDFRPDEFYHLAEQSHVQRSWDYPTMTAQVTGLGTLNCLEAIRRVYPQCRFYFAGSSEQFGNASEGGAQLDESSPMMPESPYAAAKVFGYNISQVYRRSFSMFVACGILFNHESPMRGEEFVTRRITMGLARIKHGLQTHLTLGNTQAKRDWGFAGDYVEAMWKMLQIDHPMDFVIATGETHSVQEFVDASCEFYGLDAAQVIKSDPKLFRPKDVNVLIGNARLAKKHLQWEAKTHFNSLVTGMCAYDLYYTSPDPAMRGSAEDTLGQ
jgi:GDPmannose 4,6-dehydratase